MHLRNKIQLITYPDSLGGNLRTLHEVLRRDFNGLCTGGVHILPPFPSSGDRGFAPLTYREIDPAFGSWEDIAAIGREFDITLDIMVNHLSAQSVYFKDFLQNGKNSPYADMFIPLTKIWADGIPNEDDIHKIFLRRPRPYSTFPTTNSDSALQVWTTFGHEDPSEQIDLDIHAEETKAMLRSIFEYFGQYGVRCVRLDAIGFVIKKMGTSCFFVEPDIYDFLDWIRQTARNADMEILPEVHGDPSIARKLVEHGYPTYDFVLPFTILDTLINQNSRALYRYLRDRPTGLFTMLDCHDGVPVKPDLNGLYESRNAHAVVDYCRERGAGFSLIMSDEHKDADGFDVHQIQSTYYSLLGCDDNAYIAARAIQFFVPGIPQVYYVGLLAGENDRAAVALTGDGRSINRHNYTAEEIAQALRKPVVQRLAALMSIRNTHEAFDGSFEAIDRGEQNLCLAWTNKSASCTLTVDLRNGSSMIHYSLPNGTMMEKRL